MAKGTLLQCQRCAHGWRQRGRMPPLTCPRCKNYRWREPPAGAGVTAEPGRPPHKPVGLEVKP